MTDVRVAIDRLLVDGVADRAEAERLAERVRAVLADLLAGRTADASREGPGGEGGSVGSADIVAARIARAIRDHLPEKRIGGA